MTIGNHFTGFCFFVAPDGSFIVRSYWIYLLSALWFIAYFLITMSAQCDRKTRWTLFTYSLFPLLGWALCDYDARKAGELADQFAVYLRDNYADMSEAAMIPFSSELEHIRNYLAIEEVRFPGLRVAYDIQAEGFLLPTLTVQPLVENAVRHGISKRRDASGTVKIASFEEKDRYIIRISDDGVGFDPEAHRDGKHIGIANAKTRLMLLCAGTLTLTSQRGQGTVCEIKIPKGTKPYDRDLRG